MAYTLTDSKPLTTGESQRGRRTIMEYREFIETNGLTMKTEKAPANPHMANSKEMDHWHVTITREGLDGTQKDNREMQLYFSQGLAHRKPNHFAATIDGSNYPNQASPFLMPRTTGEKRFNDFCQPTPPGLEDVLDCIASDAACVENVRNYEEFAAELGYDEDSRAGEKTYRTIQDQTVELLNLLGPDAYEMLLREIERL